MERQTLSSQFAPSFRAHVGTAGLFAHQRGLMCGLMLSHSLTLNAQQAPALGHNGLLLTPQQNPLDTVTGESMHGEA
jgi:hypothetical protein